MRALRLRPSKRPPHHRAPGPSLALLADDRVFVESVVDGVHHHQAVVQDTARRAGRRWMLVSDAMAAALAADGRYPLGRLEAGRRADLVGLDDDLQVQGVMRAGLWVER